MGFHMEQQKVTIDLAVTNLSSNTNVIHLFPQHMGDKNWFGGYCIVQVRVNSPTGGDATNDYTMKAYSQRWIDDFTPNNNNKLYFTDTDFYTPNDTAITIQDLAAGAAPGEVFIGPKMICMGSAMNGMAGQPERISHSQQFIYIQNAALTGVRHTAGTIDFILSTWG